MTLAGKHALITGGGTGIGLAIAVALRGAGATVTITGRRAEVLETAAKAHDLNPQVMDVQDETSVVDGIASAVTAHGPVQICVPNAGLAEGRALHKTDMAFWRNMMATNIDGTFLTIRESLKSMHQTDWGRVIAISSIAGLRGLKGAPCYSASKHAVIGLIRGLAADYLGKPYTFNAICPAYVDTEDRAAEHRPDHGPHRHERRRRPRGHGRRQPARSVDHPRGSGRSRALALFRPFRQRQRSGHSDRRG